MANIANENKTVSKVERRAENDRNTINEKMGLRQNFRLGIDISINSLNGDLKLDHVV